MFWVRLLFLAFLLQQPSTRAAAIGGRLSDSSRAPVADAYVQLLIKTYGDDGQAKLTRAPVLPVRTNERGEYRFNRVAPGPYYVRSSIKSAVTYYPGVSRVEEALPIDVAAGVDLAAVNYTLGSASPLRISGHIVDPFREGRGAYEYYLVRRDVRLRDSDESVEDQDSSDDGFEFRGIEPGAYDLYVGYIGDAFGSSWGYAGHAEIELIDRDITDLTIEIGKGSEIICEIKLDESAAAMNPDMRLANLWPNFRGVRGMPGPMVPSVSQESVGFLRADGKFKFAHAAPGRYRLDVRLPANPALYVSVARFGTQDVLGQEFEINENATGPLFIELSATGARLQGIVTADAGTALTQAQVWLVPNARFRGDHTAYRTTLSDSQGRFDIVAIRPGSYTLFAFRGFPVDAGAIMNDEYMSPYLNFGVPVELPKGEIIRHDLKAIGLQR